MKIKRSDGRVFEIEIISYARGEWAANVVRADDELTGLVGDPVYRTEREARRAARRLVNRLRYSSEWGWAAV